MRRNVSVGSFCHGPLQARVRRMACVSSSAVSGEPSWSVTCKKWKDAHSVDLILKWQAGLRQTLVAILNIDMDVTNGLKWRLCQAAQQSQIPLLFVCVDGFVTACDELVQKCLFLEVRYEPHNVEQALRRMTQRNLNNAGGVPCPSQSRVDTTCARLSTPRSCWDSVLQVASCQQLTSQRQLPAISFCCRATPRMCQMCLSCWSRKAKNSVEHSSVCTLLPVESFETLDQCAALIVTLNAETGLLKGRLGQSLDRSQSRGAQYGGLLVTNSSPTELASKVVAKDDTDELNRTLEDQDERRWADERRTSNAENEVEGRARAWRRSWRESTGGEHE